jgi:hypothetical protein
VKGRGFTSPRRQGGWIMLAGAVVGVAGSIAQQSGENKQNKVKYQDQRDLDSLQLEQSNWAKQQQRVWDLQDLQRAQNYKEDAIAGFRQYAPKNVSSNDGSWQAPPARTDTTGQQAGLAPVDANGQPYLLDPRTGKPVFGAPQQPDPSGGTLQQVA